MQRLIDRIGEAVRGRVAEAKFSLLEREIRKHILLTFADRGSPPSLDEIMKALNIFSVDVVRKTIGKFRKADILTTERDEIISAYPFSAVETRHKVIFENGHEVYALCATDALGIHFMTERNIAILSTCPECGKEIRIVVRNGKIDDSNPGGIVEFVSYRKSGECIAQSLCPFMNFFCSRKELNEWRENNREYGNGEIYSLHQALEPGKNIFGDFLSL